MILSFDDVAGAGLLRSTGSGLPSGAARLFRGGVARLLRGGAARLLLGGAACLTLGGAARLLLLLTQHIGWLQVLFLVFYQLAPVPYIPDLCLHGQAEKVILAFKQNFLPITGTKQMHEM
jgi:hypothetical protein